MAAYRDGDADDGPVLDFDSYVPFGLTAIANKIARSASRVYLRLFDLGINEWRVVANLRVWPGVNANHICNNSGLDKAAVSRSIALLEQRGMIVSTRDPDDARGRCLVLTPDGIVLHDRLITVALAREARLLTGFSAEERRALLGYIQRMMENVAILNGTEDRIDPD